MLFPMSDEMRERDARTDAESRGNTRIVLTGIAAMILFSAGFLLHAALAESAEPRNIPSPRPLRG